LRERAIIHINVADFAVAVERLLDSRLRRRPIVIAPEGAPRAAVYDMSEEAYQHGVRKGMALRRALRYCRDASVLPPHPSRYEQAMQSLFKQALPYSPLIEATDHKGHLFIDITGTSRLFGPPPDVAWRLRKAIRSDLGFDPIWSVAPNKLVAKTATRIVKPSGEYMVRKGEEADFLKPLPLYLIPGIEADELTRLREFNLVRVYQVLRLSVKQLEVAFGDRSGSLYETVRGIDPSPVMTMAARPPVSKADHEFGNDTNHVAAVTAALYCLTEQVGADLRTRRLAARRVGVLVDYSDGNRVVRQAAAKPATANDIRLFEAAQLALQRAWRRRIRIRHLRLICDRLTYPPAQMELFPEDAQRYDAPRKLIAAVDRIRQRFGRGAIQMGRTLAMTR
jgi:DNA polymerase-4